jgi:hypothetical protein
MPSGLNDVSSLCASSSCSITGANGVYDVPEEARKSCAPGGSIVGEFLQIKAGTRRGTTDPRCDEDEMRSCFFVVQRKLVSLIAFFTHSFIVGISSAVSFSKIKIGSCQTLRLFDR